MRPNLYEYTDVVAYLNAVFLGKKKKNYRFSLRSWARQIGDTSAAHLSMILSGKRRLLSPLADRIACSLSLSEREQEYFKVLMHLSSAQSSEEVTLFKSMLAELHPNDDFTRFENDQIKFLSDWAHIAILELPLLPDFIPDGAWISAKLGGLRTASECDEALERLVRTGLLNWTEDGSLVKSNNNHLYEGAPSIEIRSCQRQFINLGLHALETIRPDEREVACHTVATSKAKIVAAKKMVKDFRFKLARFLTNDTCDAVCQFNVQLFDLTTPADHKNNQ